MAFQSFGGTNQNQVQGFCDVLVCGGGPAGIAAAVTAAKAGKSTILVEQYGFLGGASVAGLAGTICGMYYASAADREPCQLVYGFADTFVSNLERCHGITAPQKYGNTYLRTFDAFIYKRTAEAMVLAAGADILFHTKIIAVEMDQNCITGIWVDTKSGSRLIRAGIVIDATGDGDVVYRAGFKTYKGDHGRVQNPTMIFKVSNVLMPEFLRFMNGNTIAPAAVSNQIRASNAAGEFDLPREHIWLFDTVNDGEVLCNCTRVVGRQGQELDVTDPVQHTEAEICGRDQVMEYFHFFKKYLPGFKSAYITDSGCEVGIRQTRSIAGITRLYNEDVVKCRKNNSGIAKSAWPIELHSGGTPKLHWIMDDYYTVPFGALVPETGENLVVAGRNLDAEHEALASARVAAQCFGYGEAASTAACLALDLGCRIRDIDVAAIRRRINWLETK